MAKFRILMDNKLKKYNICYIEAQNVEIYPHNIHEDIDSNENFERLQTGHITDSDLFFSSDVRSIGVADHFPGFYET